MMNGEKIGGRAVVVDWAVAKNKYEAHMAQAQETEQGAGRDRPPSGAGLDSLYCSYAANGTRYGTSEGESHFVTMIY